MSELLKTYYDECDHYLECVLKLKRLIKKIEFSPDQVEKGDLMAVRHAVAAARGCIQGLEHNVCTLAEISLDRERYRISIREQ